MRRILTQETMIGQGNGFSPHSNVVPPRKALFGHLDTTDDDVFQIMCRIVLYGGLAHDHPDSNPIYFISSSNALF